MTYLFRDGRFSLWAALYDTSLLPRRTVFRVREDSTPRIRAAEKGIAGYKSLRPATHDEVVAWLRMHPDYPVLEKEDEGHVAPAVV